MIVEKRQPMFDAGVFAPCTYGLIKRIVCACRAKFNTVSLAKARNRRFVQDNLGHWCQFNNRQLFRGALCCRIKPAGAVQHVPKEVKPHWPRLPRRIDINNAAADRIITRLYDSGALGEAHAHQKRSQRLFIHLVPDSCDKTCPFKHAARRDALGRGIKSGQQDKLFRPTRHEPRQNRHPRRRDICIGRCAVVGQTIPRRKADNWDVRCEKRQSLAHRFKAFVITRHVNNATTFFVLSQK